MVGNMGGSPLAMALAFIVRRLCDVGDLDGPFALAATLWPMESTAMDKN
jgi:phage FluMu protein gp41